MNHTQTIKTLASQTNESIHTVERITKVMKTIAIKTSPATRKHLTDMVEFISNETLIPVETCSKVMTQFFELVKRNQR